MGTAVIHGHVGDIVAALPVGSEQALGERIQASLAAALEALGFIQGEDSDLAVLTFDGDDQGAGAGEPVVGQLLVEAGGGYGVGGAGIYFAGIGSAEKGIH